MSWCNSINYYLFHIEIKSMSEIKKEAIKELIHIQTKQGFILVSNKNTV